jgi:hypothetical protein
MKILIAFLAVPFLTSLLFAILLIAVFLRSRKKTRGSQQQESR